MISGFLFAAAALAQLTPKQTAENLASFEQVWRTVRDRHPDMALNGLNWQAVHDATRPLIVKAKSMEKSAALLRDMVNKLDASHYAVIPSDRYDRLRPPNRRAGDRARGGKVVTFGNLPETRVTFEARELEGGTGYIRFNEFLDP